MTTTTTYRRRNRILCLHGATQSSASFRAALKPVCDRMESNWEFHFLDAPFIVADEDDVNGKQRGTNVWSEAAILASELTALDAELMYAQSRGIGSRNDDGAEQELRQWREQTWKQLSQTHEGQQVWQMQQRAGTDGVESLVSTKVAKSMSRAWVARTSHGTPIGIDVGLAMIGDYMREHGTFHGAIGYDAAGTLTLLLQALLSHPRSSSQAFPAFFARLPQGVSRMPRMGGWEEEPPAADDVRLGAENLTKDFVPAQKPFEVLVVYHPNNTQQLGKRCAEWLRQKQPILSTSWSSDSFASHSLAIQQGYEDQVSDAMISLAIEHRLVHAPDAYMFSKDSSEQLTNFLTLAMGSCQGDQDARQKLSQRNSQHQSSTLQRAPPSKL